MRGSTALTASIRRSLTVRLECLLDAGLICGTTARFGVSTQTGVVWSSRPSCNLLNLENCRSMPQLLDVVWLFWPGRNPPSKLCRTRGYRALILDASCYTPERCHTRVIARCRLITCWKNYGNCNEGLSTKVFTD